MGSGRRDPGGPLTGLPHGYPFIFIDRVEELSASRGVGIKNVSADSFFSFSRDEGPCYFPEILLIESMAQVSGLVMNFGLEQKSAAVLAAINEMRFERRAVACGSVFVTSVLEGSFGHVASFIVEASAAGERIASGRLTLSGYSPDHGGVHIISGRQAG